MTFSLGGDAHLPTLLWNRSHWSFPLLALTISSSCLTVASWERGFAVEEFSADWKRQRDLHGRKLLHGFKHTAAAWITNVLFNFYYEMTVTGGLTCMLRKKRCRKAVSFPPVVPCNYIIHRINLTTRSIQVPFKLKLSRTRLHSSHTGIKKDMYLKYFSNQKNVACGEM